MRRLRTVVILAAPSRMAPEPTLFVVDVTFCS